MQHLLDAWILIDECLPKRGSVAVAGAGTSAGGGGGGGGSGKNKDAGKEGRREGRRGSEGGPTELDPGLAACAPTLANLLRAATPLLLRCFSHRKPQVSGSVAVAMSRYDILN